MCCGGTYLDITTGAIIKVFFPIPNAIIPVIKENGEYIFCQWGQRERDKNLLNDLPVTGWARIESLEKSYWQKHNPENILIPFKSFFEKDRTALDYPKSKASEFKLNEKELLRGLLIKHPDKEIVYILTRPIKSWIHDRYPVLTSENS